MATNHHFQSGKGIGTVTEKNLIRDLIDESIKITGLDVIYIPRQLANFDQLFGEDSTSYFNKFVTIEMYFESISSFGGRDDFLSKFGLQTKEEAIFRVSKRRWEELVGSRGITQNTDRPNEGDLVYLPLDNNLFEIKHVSMKDPFYQLNDFYSYILECSLFQYSSERIETGLGDVDTNIPPSLDNLKYQFISPSENVTIDATQQELTSVGIDKIDYNSDNKKINDINTTIQDFTEQNPFGLG